MSKNKIQRDTYTSVIYTEESWNNLNNKRRRALELLEMFIKEPFIPYIYGSIARGNVHKDSDIDIIFLQQVPLYKIEFLLNKNGYINLFREIIMATPNDSIKLYIYLNELESITIPLTKLDKSSVEFYDFGGKVNYEQLKSDIRVPGVDKRLVLIKPNKRGHSEYSIIGREHIVAKEIHISLKTVNERKRILLKREKFGRTGVFLKRQIDMNESPQEVLKSLANTNSIIRKKLYRK